MHAALFLCRHDRPRPIFVYGLVGIKLSDLQNKKKPGSAVCFARSGLLGTAVSSRGLVSSNMIHHALRAPDYVF